MLWVPNPCSTTPVSVAVPPAFRVTPALSVVAVVPTKSVKDTVPVGTFAECPVVVSVTVATMVIGCS